MHALDRIERHAIAWALSESRGDVAAAARRLGLPTRTLYHRAHARGVSPSRAREDTLPDEISLAEICGQEE